MSEKSPTLAKIEEAIEEIGKDKRRPWRCLASEVFGPVTFRDLLGGARFPQGEGVYVIWGEADEARPLYVGMTTKGQCRPLDHLKHPHQSPAGEAFRERRACLDWAVFFCPLLRDSTRYVPCWLSCALLSFERKIVKELKPWFWHGGLQDALDCPYISDS